MSYNRTSLYLPLCFLRSLSCSCGCFGGGRRTPPGSVTAVDCSSPEGPGANGSGRGQRKRGGLCPAQPGVRAGLCPAGTGPHSIKASIGAFRPSEGVPLQTGNGHGAAYVPLSSRLTYFPQLLMKPVAGCCSGRSLQICSFFPSMRAWALQGGMDGSVRSSSFWAGGCLSPLTTLHRGQYVWAKTREPNAKRQAVARCPPSLPGVPLEDRHGAMRARLWLPELKPLVSYFAGGGGT